MIHDGISPDEFLSFVHEIDLSFMKADNIIRKELEQLDMEKFKYTREIHDDMNSVLEFETYIDDISVNGVDMIEWNEDGKICNFKVMIRPFKAVQKVQEKMIEALESLS